jgi:hypothetical protein
MHTLSAFSRWTYDRYFDPMTGWNTDHYYGNCTFANHVFFLFPSFGEAQVMGFAGDAVRCGLHERGLPFGHDFVVRPDGLIGDLWAMDYLGTPLFGRPGRGLYPPVSELVTMPVRPEWIERIRADWTTFRVEHIQYEG